MKINKVLSVVDHTYRKTFAIALSIMMFVPSNLGTVFAASGNLDPDLNKNIKISMAWQNTSDNLLTINANSPSAKNLSQRVTYTSSKVDKDYEAGSFMIVSVGFLF